MQGSSRLRVTIVWLLLIAATVFSWESAQSGTDQRLATTAVLVVAFVKIRMIGLEFMELRGAPLALRFVFEAWTALVCAVLLTLYWLAPATR